VPFGAVNQITARLPNFLLLLFGCLLIYRLLRKVAAGFPAALFGVALFLACPLVIRLYVSVTPDLPLAVSLFFAFVLWWDGYTGNKLTAWRWLAIGLVLAFAGGFKGPEPVAYFGLGIGLYVLITRSWRQIPWLVLCGVICLIPVVIWGASIYASGDQTDWLAYMRIAHPRAVFYGPIEAIYKTAVELLPAVLAAAAFFIARAFGEKRVERTRFVGALACYAFVAAVPTLFWPGGSATRYYLPMAPALAVFGGLAYDELSLRRPQIVAPLLLVTMALLLYALGYSLASPFFPQQFRQPQVEGAQVSALIHNAPGTIYVTSDAALNLLPYLPEPILYASLDQMITVPAPAWMIVTPEAATALLARRAGKLEVVRPLGEAQQWRLLHAGQ